IISCNQWLQMLPRELRNAGGGGFIRVQLDRYATWVTDRVQRVEDLFEINHAFTRREVLMHTVLADVFQVHVRDEMGVVADHFRGIVADTKKVPDVAVHLDQRLVLEMPVTKVEELLRGLDE